MEDLPKKVKQLLTKDIIKRKKSLLAIFIVILLVIGFFVYRNIAKKVDLQEKRETFENMVSGIEIIIQNDVPKLLESEHLVKEVNCSYKSLVRRDPAAGYYIWEEFYSTTIQVKDEFDSWSTARQYQYIDELGDTAIALFDSCVREIYPDYGQYRTFNGPLSEIYGGSVFPNGEREIIIKTSQNTYEYATRLRNYYLKNGKDVYVRDENGDWNSGSYDSYVQNDNGKCILSHCDLSAKSGKSYCGRHGCCIDGCNRQKDPTVHCCDVHNCAYPRCGAHRYTYANSEYCKTHHYNN